MFHDDQQFHVDGSSKEQLEKTIELLLTFYHGNVEGVKYDKEAGVLSFYGFKLPKDADNGVQTLPATKNCKLLTELAWEWLSNSDTKEHFRRTSGYYDIDGSVEVGWDLLVPRRGFDNLNHICDIRLTWLYYGK
jgi:hypothetical protein